MFDCKQTLTGRLTDAVDLLMDFATLGEYGLEPAGRTTRACEEDRAGRCQESFQEALFPNQCATRARTRAAALPQYHAVRAGMRRGSEAFEKQA
jgi:hypothetical protein